MGLEDHGKDANGTEAQEDLSPIQLVGWEGELAEQLFDVERYKDAPGHLNGEGVWIGVGKNPIYTAKFALSRANWALENGADRVLIVPAHEIAAENKMALKKVEFHLRKAVLRVDVPGIEIDSISGPREVPLFPPNAEEEVYDATAERRKYLRELRAHRKLADTWKKEAEEMIPKLFGSEKAGKIQVKTQAEVYEVLAETVDPKIAAIKNLLLEGLLLNAEFREDLQRVMRESVPGLWNRLQEGEIHEASAYIYTSEQILLTYLLACQGWRVKMGPEGERGPDGIAKRFIEHEYNYYPLPQEPQKQGFIYLQ